MFVLFVLLSIVAHCLRIVSGKFLDVLITEGSRVPAVAVLLGAHGSRSRSLAVSIAPRVGCERRVRRMLTLKIWSVELRWANVELWHKKFCCPDCRESTGINPLVVENRNSVRCHWIMTGGLNRNL